MFVCVAFVLSTFVLHLIFFRCFGKVCIVIVSFPPGIFTYVFFFFFFFFFLFFF